MNRLQAIAMTQKEEARRNANKKATTSFTSGEDMTLSATSVKAGKTGKGFFDMYRATDSKDMSRLLSSKGKGTATEILEAKLKFKEKYEKLLEKNVKDILMQFFPKNSFLVKMNVEVSNLMTTSEDTPETLIARITTLVLLDENNPNVRITPENKEVVIKGDCQLHRICAWARLVLNCAYRR